MSQESKTQFDQRGNNLVLTRKPVPRPPTPPHLWTAKFQQIGAAGWPSIGLKNEAIKTPVNHTFLPDVTKEQKLTIDAVVMQPKMKTDELIKERCTFKKKLYNIMLNRTYTGPGQCNWCDEKIDHYFEWRIHQLTEHPLETQALRECREQNWFPDL